MKQKHKQKQIKPRNPIVVALMKRNGSGVHEKTHKQLRSQWKLHLNYF
jgi:hypothetical protein